MSEFPPEETNLHRYLDLGWDGNGWSPSALFVIGESILASEYLAPKLRQQSKAQLVERFHAGLDKAEIWRAHFIGIARQRWKDGFYADPFTSEPKRREG